MSEKYVSELGKVECQMKATALTEAKEWADLLLDREFRGRGDREKSVRYRLAKKLGIAESYLFRLQYKTQEMRDVAGSVYRALRNAYEDMCAANEAAADNYREQRIRLRGPHETVCEESLASSVRMVAAARSSGPSQAAE
jgi:hypothetical protein